MKQCLLYFFLVSTLTATSQSLELAGNYEYFSGNDSSYFLKDKLTLNPNGTFLLRSHSFISERMPSERIQYGKGRWTSEKRLIFLKAEPTDIDDTHVLNLNNTKLRYDTKSPRDKSNRDIKTSVRIIDTEIFWLKGRTLIKGANTTPIIQKTECCKSIREVHDYLNGKWAKKNDIDQEYHYSFKDEQGIFEVFSKNEEGILEALNKNPAAVKIIKSDYGFKIEQDFNGLKMYSVIKHLDSTKLTTSRIDGKESTLYRIHK